MIEKVDLAAIVDIINGRAFREALPGLDLDQRLRSLRSAVFLRDGEHVACLVPKWGGDFQAIVFDTETAPVRFVADVFNHLFDPASGLDCNTISFTTRLYDGGEQFRAYRRGMIFSGEGFVWSLHADDWRMHPLAGRSPIPVDPNKPRPGQRRKLSTERAA